MDNYTVIYEFPDDVRFSFTHLYFDPPGFSGIKERVFCAERRDRPGHRDLDRSARSAARSS